MKIIRATTVPESLDAFCQGILRMLNEKLSQQEKKPAALLEQYSRIGRTQLALISLPFLFLDPALSKRSGPCIF